MEGVGRNEILNWVNDLLQLDYKKIEQMGSGAALCQLIDVIHPGKINLKMVNFNAKYDYEYIKNFSYLQEAFAKLGVEKYVEVSELVKSRPQANLEFCQWIKKYFDNLYSGEPYNALERRVQLKITTDRDKTLLKGSKISAPPSTTTTKPAGVSKPTATTVSKPTTTTTTTTVKPTTTSTIPKPTTSTGLKSKPTAAATISKPTATTVSKPKPSTTTSTTTTTTSVSTPPSTPSQKSTPSNTAPPSTSKPTISQPGFKPTPKSVSPTPPTTSAAVQPTTITTTKTIVVSEAPAELLAELEQQKQQLLEQKLEIEQQKQELEAQRIQIQEMTEKITKQELVTQDVEKDRDFYFDRLREAEIFCQQHESNELLGHVLKILYSSDQDEEIEGEEGIEGDQVESEPEPDIDQLKIDGEQEEHEEIHSEQEDQIHSQEEQIHSEEEHFEHQEDGEEDIDGLNEEEIMNKVLQESDHDDDDDILDSTFNGEDELLETQEELLENLDQDEF